MGSCTLCVFFALAEFLAHAHCFPDWKDFIENSQGVERVYNIPSYDDKVYTCPNGTIRIPSVKVCNGDPDCRSIYVDDEDELLCAPDITTDLQLREMATTNFHVTLAWKRPPRSSHLGMRFFKHRSFKLAGYFLTTMSKRQAFKQTIDFGLSHYNVSFLTPGTKYNIILRPVYVDDRSEVPDYRIGRASTIDFETLASAPEEPQNVSLVSASQRNVQLNIVNPFLWNGVPVGYRVRWESMLRSGGSGETFIEIHPTSGEDPINVNLTLEPGETYRIFVSARSTDNTKVTYDSAEATAYVGTLPLEPADVFANILAPGKIMVGWKNLRVASFFRVTAKYPSYIPTTLHVDSLDYYASQHRIVFNLTSSEPRGHESYLEAKHLKDAMYKIEVHVAACSVGGCSKNVTAQVLSSSVEILRPRITRASSKDTKSIEVEWTLPSESDSGHDGFIVHYCAVPSLCREVHTTEMSIHATNLTPATRYEIEVRAWLRNGSGKTRLGPADTVRVTTLSAVPQKPQVTQERIGPDFAVFSWIVTNRTATYLQISDVKGVWTNCTGRINCTADVLQKLTKTQMTGFLTLTSLMPYTDYSFSLRGCCEEGCGEDVPVHLRTNMSDPSEPINVRVKRGKGGLREITWQKPLHANGPLNGYLFSWECTPGEKFSTRIRDHREIIIESPIPGGQCSASVAAFNINQEGITLVGKPVSFETLT